MLFCSSVNISVIITLQRKGLKKLRMSNQRINIIKRVKDRTECAIEDEQCVFMQGRRCMDQAYGVKQVRKKYLVNGKYVFLTIMDLEMPYDTIDLHGMCQMRRLYGV